MDDGLEGAAAAGRELARNAIELTDGEEPPSSPQAFVSRRTVLKREGRLPEAATLLKQGIVRFPDADELIHEYAWISHELGDFTFGALHWRHLRAQAPANLDGYLGGGLASRRAGAFDAADRIYALGIARFPTNQTLQVDYAWSAEERGDLSMTNFPDGDFALGGQVS